MWEDTELVRFLCRVDAGEGGCRLEDAGVAAATSTASAPDPLAFHRVPAIRKKHRGRGPPAVPAIPGPRLACLR